MPLRVQKEAEAMWGTTTAFSHSASPGFIAGSSSKTSRPALQLVLTAQMSVLMGYWTDRNFRGICGVMACEGNRLYGSEAAIWGVYAQSRSKDVGRP